MQYILDGKQMKEIDRYSIGETGIPSLVLMERAALCVCAAVQQNFTSRYKVLSICGNGNNGADAAACARILSESGYETAVCFVDNMEHATEELRIQLSILQKLSVPVVTMDEIADYDIIIDGIFGIGLSREVTGRYRQAIDRINTAGKTVVAVDIPSGVDATDGRILGTAVRADYTVTFGYLKTGMLLYPGNICCGSINVVNCGFAGKAIDLIPDKKFIYEKSDLEKLPERTPDSNKGTYGKVLIIAGSGSMSGAAYFSAKAAYRTGAGLVRVMTAKSNKEVIQTLLPEAVLSFYDEISTEELGKSLVWADVIVIGPGLSMAELQTRILYETLEFLPGKEKKVLLDADALNIIARDNRRELLKNCIITPHLGEMARLCGTETGKIKEQIIETASAFSKKYDCVCVLKDARSVVSDGKQIYLNVSGNSGMSTAGSGDVLTGIIAGMLAGGMDLFEGAVLGTYIHGLAGDSAREQFGERFMKADDIADSIKNII